MALLTQTELLAYLKSNAVAGTTLYTQYDALRRSVSAAVRRYVKWGIEANNNQGQGNFIEFYDGNNYPDLILRNPWVAGVNGVWLSFFGNYGGGTNAFAPASLLTQGTIYNLVYEQPGRCQSGLLRMLSSNLQGWFPSDYAYYWQAGGLSQQPQPYWPRGTGNIKVCYDWGFQPATAISSLTWSSGVAYMAFANPIVARPGDLFQITDDANWKGSDYQVATIDPTFKNVSFNVSTNPGSFSAGNADFIPLDIKEAVALGVKIASLMMLRAGPVTSENLGDYGYSVTLREKEFLGVRMLLSAYRDWSVAIGL